MARLYFGTDGVRGIVGEFLTPELVEQRLDLFLFRIGQLLAVTVEELHAVVFGRVVRCRDDASQVERQERDSRSRQHTGDFVIVVNAEKIQVTGNKLDQKRYYRHSGYPGGIRSRTLREQLERRPEEVLRAAVKGMLPKNRLARQQITKLKIYAGPEHPHGPQAPQPLKWEDR